MATAIVSKKNLPLYELPAPFFGCQVAKKMRHPKDNSATDEPKMFFLFKNLKLMHQEA
jgi:hypothetical protein